MDAIGLDRARNVDQVLVNHWHEGDVMFCGEIAEDLIEGVDVVGPVVRWERDACKQYFDVCVRKGGDHGVEVAACLAGRKPAQPVVAAELDNRESGVQSDDEAKIGDCILSGGAAGAFVEDPVAIPEFVELALQCVGIRLPGSEAVARRNAVSIADENRPVGREERSAEGQKTAA